jgi:ATP-dependent Lon protease
MSENNNNNENENEAEDFMVLTKTSDENGELIPLLSDDDVADLDKDDIPDELLILPVKNTVLFPGVVLPITVSRQKSVRLVKKAYKGNKIIGVIAQKKSNEEPTSEDLYSTGTVAHIMKLLALPDGNTTIIIQGKRKFEIAEILQEDPHISVKASVRQDSFPVKDKREGKAIMASLKELALKILRLNPDIPQEAQLAIDNIDNGIFLTNFLSSNLNVEVKDKQRLLECVNAVERANLLMELMTTEIQYLELKQKIQHKVHTDLDQQQRDHYLRHQIKVMQDELGSEPYTQEINAIKQKAEGKKWPESVEAHFNKEIDKLSRIHSSSPEYGITLNYTELLVDLPWGSYTSDNFNLNKARKVLDADHFGMEKVKERILEYLAVLKLRNDMKAPILCLYGPPGVGKTSLGKSIAKAMGRKYIRMSLGGVRDEAEIRGHRRTYIGAMPGRIIQQIKKAGSSNPVLILDELDKIASDFRGDPASALLEVLDPEQNNTFTDNYLEVEYDLSKVMFIATTNSLDTLHPALRDRMEIIELTGYTLEEKVEIAKRHLVPKQLEENGLAKKFLKFDPSGLVRLTEDYTRESGVRNLDRAIGQVVRKIAVKFASGLPYHTIITGAVVRELLGPAKVDKDEYQETEAAGVVIGLAWTPVGGDILYIESSLSRGKGKVSITGQLGDVMKESTNAALSYLKAHADDLGIDYKTFDNFDIHLHVPAGAVPKDGPSAGITMLTSLASLYTQRKVRPRLAMTGEITLRGKVLPVGGIKEKLLAAKRAGIKEVIMCSRNRKDVDEIPESYLTGLTIHYVDHASEVLSIALLGEMVNHPIDLAWRGDGFGQGVVATA